jgi:hypothetical protein
MIKNMPEKIKEPINTEQFNPESITHYFLDDNLMPPLHSPIINLPDNQHFLLMLDLFSTTSLNPVNEMIYERRGEIFHRLVRFSNDSFGLIRNTDGQYFQPDGRYNYILEIVDGIPTIRIDQQPHFYLNGKRFDHVLCAGEIEFTKTNNVSKVTCMNDKSGAYHLNFFQDESLKKAKLECIEKAIRAVGLPREVFTFFIENQQTNDVETLRKVKSMGNLKQPYFKP